jgi:Uma2 family endonuclease
MRLAFVRESDIDHRGDAMTLFCDERPITEADFIALGETRERIELFDGSLFVTPAPTPRHQKIVQRLTATMDHSAEALGLQVLEAVNLRLRPNRITIPDLVIATADVDLDRLFLDAASIRLVGEITSPSNAAVDRVLKKHYYAEAGIPWYLLVEQETRTVCLFRLGDGGYLPHAVAPAGEVLELTEPITATIDLGRLLPPR